MAQTPGDKTEPSLELPQLKLPGFGRRKRSRIHKDEPSSTPEGAGDPSPDPADAPPGQDAPVEDPTPADVPLGEPSPGPDPEPTQQIASAPEPRAGSEEPAAPHQPQRRASEPEPTEVLDLEPAPAEPELSPRPRRRAQRERSGLSVPTVPGRVAAAVTGLVVGAAGAGATYAAMAGCKAVRGVSSCGGAPGFLILVAIVVLMILLGAGLLKVLRVGDPGSTSFLAVGVVTVVVMLALLDVVFSAAMFVVVPGLSALAYLLAHWVTTRFEGEQTGRRDWT